MKRVKLKKVFLWMTIILWAALITFFWAKFGGRRVILPDIWRPFLSCVLALAALWAFWAANKPAAKIAGLLVLLWCSFLSLCSPLIYAFFYKLRRGLTYGDIYAILQSNGTESYYYFVDYFLSPRGLMIGAAVLLFSGLVLAKVIRAARSAGPIPIKSLIGCGLVCTAVSLALFSQLYPIKNARRAYSQYFIDIAEYSRLSGQIEATSNLTVDKDETGELYVIVIGESESRDFMGVYHGPYDNTPWLDSIDGDESWVVFTNAYSHHTHTVQSLSAALGEGRALTGLTFPRGSNIISLSRKAGIKSHWISNQAIMGPWDSAVAILAQQADETIFMDPDQISFGLRQVEPDGQVIPHLEETLRKLDLSRNNLIVVHLMGSHSPYRQRYPESFPYLDLANKGLMGEKADDDDVGDKFSQYMTALRYTDSVLKGLHAAVVKYTDRPAFMLYFADHGEDVFSKDGGHDFDSFTWTKARIPMLLWLSEGYRQRYPETVEQLKKNAERPFTNDLIDDLYIGLADMDIEGFEGDYDISDADYALNFDNAVIAAGKKISDDPWLRAKANIENEALGFLAMHRANSVFKAAQGQELGLNRLEVDLVFTSVREVETLFVGHDEDSLTGLSFEEYLELLPQKPAFLWLDVKNLSEDNRSEIRQCLQDLDASYGLKSISLLESGSPENLELFSREGWETSYYLPWSKLIEASKKSDLSLFEEVAALVKRHRISGVSYDLRADRAVSEVLKPLLPEGASLYAWNTKYAFDDKDLPDKLGELQHLKTLLIKFQSPYKI